MVLVILIALWALVLLPPYLKDRRSSSRSFRSMGSGNLGGVTLPPANAQRFLPLQQASSGVRTAPVAAPTGVAVGQPMSAPAQPNLGHPAHSNVVQLRPSDEDAVAGFAHEITAASGLDEPPMPIADGGVLGVPTSKAAARERRRHVLMTLTGLAFVTLLAALAAGGAFVALHVFLDVVMLGYVILLVRHRQIAADHAAKIEPIRPPVSEQPPVPVQIAPSYLLRSGT